MVNAHDLLIAAQILAHGCRGGDVFVAPMSALLAFTYAVPLSVLFRPPGGAEMALFAAQVALVCGSESH
jgi:hypothetical protein